MQIYIEWLKYILLVPWQLYLTKLLIKCMHDDNWMMESTTSIKEEKPRSAFIIVIANSMDTACKFFLHFKFQNRFLSCVVSHPFCISLQNFECVDIFLATSEREGKRMALEMCTISVGHYNIPVSTILVVLECTQDTCSWITMLLNKRSNAAPIIS